MRKARVTRRACRVDAEESRRWWCSGACSKVDLAACDRIGNAKDNLGRTPLRLAAEAAVAKAKKAAREHAPENPS